MLLSTQTDILGQRHGDLEAIAILADIGFDAYDFSFFQMCEGKPYWANQSDFREQAKALRKEADRLGIVCNQAHAPFASSFGDPQKDQERFEAIVRSMEAAAILGAKNIVVHPCQHLEYATHADELLEINIAFYRRLEPYCRQFGIRAAVENMWQYNRASGRIVDSTCSRPAEFCRYLDEIGSPWVVGCLDVGHTTLTDEDLGYFVRTLGKGRLQALHVHDNNLWEDSHTFPFTNKIDFAPLIDSLADIRYEGDFTFEADESLRHLPPELESAALTFLEKIGRYFIRQIESKMA